MNGYTESDEKVKARLERRAMAHQEALAEQLAAEQQRVNSTHYFEGLAKIEAEIVAIRTSAEVDPRLTRQSQILYALNDEPVTKEAAESLIEELAEIEASTQKNPPEFGGKEWYNSIKPIEI